VDGDGDDLEAATVVDTMASAVRRLRRLAINVFADDAALFPEAADPSGDDATGAD
jgi:hypothetical protein